VWVYDAQAAERSDADVAVRSLGDRMLAQAALEAPTAVMARAAVSKARARAIRGIGRGCAAASCVTHAEQQPGAPAGEPCELDPACGRGGSAQPRIWRG